MSPHVGRRVHQSKRPTSPGVLACFMSSCAFADAIFCLFSCAWRHHFQQLPAVHFTFAGLKMTQVFLVIMMVAVAAASVAGGACNGRTECYANHDALYNHTAMDTPENAAPRALP